MLWDMHIHSHFSTDSRELTGNIVQAAAAKGLLGICITDHMDIDYPGPTEAFSFDAASYFKELLPIRTSKPHALSVKIGVELGLQPHLDQKHHAFLADYPFDFVIGSSHLVDGKDPYYEDFFENITEDEGYYQYFASIKKNILAFSGFDVYGHLDYIVRYGPNKNTGYTYRKYSDIIDEILKLLIERGKGIEINTGGFQYGLNHPNPTEDIIKRYRELGGEIITLGSDAHSCAHIGSDFHKLPALLKDAGFQYYTVFSERRPWFLKI